MQDTHSLPQTGAYLCPSLEMLRHNSTRVSWNYYLTTHIHIQEYGKFTSLSLTFHTPSYHHHTLDIRLFVYYIYIHTNAYFNIKKYILHEIFHSYSHWNIRNLPGISQYSNKIFLWYITNIPMEYERDIPLLYFQYSNGILTRKCEWNITCCLKLNIEW